MEKRKPVQAQKRASVASADVFRPTAQFTCNGYGDLNIELLAGDQEFSVFEIRMHVPDLSNSDEELVVQQARSGSDTVFFRQDMTYVNDLLWAPYRPIVIMPRKSFKVFWTPTDKSVFWGIEILFSDSPMYLYTKEEFKISDQEAEPIIDIYAAGAFFNDAAEELSNWNISTGHILSVKEIIGMSDRHVKIKLENGPGIAGETILIQAKDEAWSGNSDSNAVLITLHDSAS